ncbi:LPS-assembly protein LptD [Prevotella communis]|uniref:putative LPS assembly protein LptD n=1 Tax=Prevotella communis TaxID=2913614 RepID=UPI001EDA8549|nr:putative LPS assembly protein LptD [Prevotella communis]UKK68551.1 LPS-assembly protein LptD [Prevotella communis]UKK69314.1 LPS-assembly protein LptD [Prevotella communis]
MLAGIPSTPYQDNSRTLDGDSLEVADSILFDSILASLDTVPASFDSLFSDTTISRGARQAAAALKRDTTVMDSLELAIYLHNKAVDDSLALDSINRQRKHGIDSPVEFSANDSLLYEAGHGMAYLFGNSHVKYQNMDLQSENIYLSLDSSLVHATGARDSVSGKLFGNPVFQMGSDTYQSDTMAFNFKTKKGFIQQVYTEQQEGYLTSQLSKRGANGELYLQHGRYTTCDEPHPDFYLALSRAKVRPGKDVVFGPAYLVVCDVPLPLAIPYGFFPFTKSYSSGFIMPTYGDETERGFYLRDGGYYFAISDQMDLKLLGEIYTKGSWGVSAASNYRKRYRYSGSFYGSYQNSVTGEKNLPDYSKTTSFKIQWSHRQDAKANPYSTLSASVNFATSSYERNNLTSMYNPQTMTQSTRTSSVSYSTSFSSIGMSLSTTMNLNQNMRDSTIAMTMPDLNISISRFYPFKRKHMVGKQRWYEKIAMSYTGHFSNSISTKEDKLMHSNLIKDWRNGMQHSIPVSASFTVLNYINLTASFNFTDRTYTNKIMRSWDGTTEQRDTIYGLYNVYNWNMSLAASTKLYGFLTPPRGFLGGRIQKIRHVFTPQVSLNYAPDFSASRYGYYETYQKTDSEGNVTMVEYSPFQNSLYGVPGKGKTGSIAFDMSNNLEMKMYDRNDSLRKISLIDEFGASMSYNMAAKIRPWSDLSTRIRLKLTKNYTLNMNAVFASYVYEADSVGARPRLSEHTTYWEQGKIGRFQGMSQNLSYTISNEKISKIFKWLRGERDNKKDKDENEPALDDINSIESNVDPDMEKAKHGARKQNAGLAETDEDGYMPFSMPWSVSFGYGITMREDTDVKKFNYNTMRYPYKFTQNLNMSGNIRLSDGWNISFSSGYDFENKKISMTTASLSRDLHCFNMSCSVVLSPYTSYNFSFRCNASTLTDALKYDKRSGYSNSVQWY